MYLWCLQSESLEPVHKVGWGAQGTLNIVTGVCPWYQERQRVVYNCKCKHKFRKFIQPRKIVSTGWRPWEKQFSSYLPHNWVVNCLFYLIKRLYSDEGVQWPYCCSASEVNFSWCQWHLQGKHVKAIGDVTIEISFCSFCTKVGRIIVEFRRYMIWCFLLTSPSETQRFLLSHQGHSDFSFQ